MNFYQIYEILHPHRKVKIFKQNYSYKIRKQKEKQGKGKVQIIKQIDCRAEVASSAPVSILQTTQKMKIVLKKDGNKPIG